MTDIISLLDQLEPGVRQAFLRSCADIKNEVQQTLIIKALERGDIRGAVELCNLRPELLAPMEQMLDQAFVEGGVQALAALPRLPDPFLQGGSLPDLMLAIRVRKKLSAISQAPGSKG